ncbi:MAG: 30S ribosomal protein S6 [Patescibacteria group bacterium]|jgi:small subunit ribosomal protein S6
MSKTKSSDKIHYELLSIIPNKFTEEEAIAINEKVKKQITDLGGEISFNEDWGNKKLAYDIRGFSHGYYKLIEFDLLGVELSKLNNFLRLSKDILRHQIIKIKKRSPEKIKADTKKAEELYHARKNQKSAPAIEKKSVPTTLDTPTSPTTEKPTEEKKFSKKKTDLKDLDKKLDDILETNDLL